VKFLIKLVRGQVRVVRAVVGKPIQAASAVVGAAVRVLRVVRNTVSVLTVGVFCGVGYFADAVNALWHDRRSFVAMARNGLATAWNWTCEKLNAVKRYLFCLGGQVLLQARQAHHWLWGSTNFSPTLAPCISGVGPLPAFSGNRNARPIGGDRHGSL
jgi:hypothetical protein